MLSCPRGALHLFVGVAKLVHALGLGPSGATHEGSNPSSDTLKQVRLPRIIPKGFMGGGILPRAQKSPTKFWWGICLEIRLIRN